MCPENTNPGDFFMDMMTKDNIPYKEDRDPEILKQNLAIRDEKFDNRVNIFTEAYQNSNLRYKEDADIYN